MLITAVCGMLLSSAAIAQEGSDQGSDPDVQAIMEELKQIHKEVTALRVELGQVRRELQKMKASDGRKPDRGRQPDTTIYPIKTDGSPILGPADAKVTITEFIDVQCPWCAKEWPKIQQIMKEYPNDVRVVFKNFPLRFHKDAKPAQAAMMLAFQKKGNDAFWQMHDLILESARKKDLSVKTVRGFAEQVGLDLAEFDRVMGDEAETNKLLAADITEASRTKVRGTPTILINGLKLAQRDIDGYKARISDILEGKGSAGAPTPPEDARKQFRARGARPNVGPVKND
jgi:protein-disulfide isomerase